MKKKNKNEGNANRTGAWTCQACALLVRQRRRARHFVKTAYLTRENQHYNFKGTLYKNSTRILPKVVAQF